MLAFDAIAATPFPWRASFLRLSPNPDVKVTLLHKPFVSSIEKVGHVMFFPSLNLCYNKETINLNQNHISRNN